MILQVGRPITAVWLLAVAVVSIDPIELISGNLPRASQRLVEAWAEIHKAELLANWERLQAGQPPLKIEPLR